jgi:predicted rRNA methylase YqxC with S4 and FtsJ domains
MRKQRLDTLLAERGLFPSRSRAAASVMAGEVCVGPERRRAQKPGEQVAVDVAVSVAERARFVSRGGIKLENALLGTGVAVAGRRALDVGASTGGFTDCLLQRGAAEVVAVDVGYGELAYSLRTDPRVRVLERTNARTLTPEILRGALDGAAGEADRAGERPHGVEGARSKGAGTGAGSGARATELPVLPDVPVLPDLPVLPDVPAFPDLPVLPDVPAFPDLPALPDLAVVDVSFISLAKVLPAVLGCLAADCELLALVKPQFEVGRARVGHGGVVRSAEDRRSALTAVGLAALELGIAVLGFCSSGLPGPKGNRETFIWLARASDHGSDRLGAGPPVDADAGDVVAGGAVVSGGGAAVAVGAEDIERMAREVEP